MKRICGFKPLWNNASNWIYFYYLCIFQTSQSHFQFDSPCVTHNQYSFRYSVLHSIPRFSTNNPSTSWNKLTVWTSIVSLPRIIMTTKFPAIIKFNALLCALRLHRPANIIKFLSIDTNRRFKHSYFIRRPPLYLRFPRDSLPNGDTGISSDDNCPRSFARSNRYYSTNRGNGVPAESGEVRREWRYARCRCDSRRRDSPPFAAAIGPGACHDRSDAGFWCAAARSRARNRGLRVSKRERKKKIRRGREQSRQIVPSDFLSRASLRSCFLDLDKGTSDWSGWLEKSSERKKEGRKYGICDYLWNDGLCQLSMTPFL